MPEAVSEIENWQRAGFGIYIHWPFCAAKCPYCDFNSHVVQQIDHSAWRAAYLSDLNRYAEETAGRVVSSIFFGGGTPSLMHPSDVGAIIERIAARWTLANDVEITLEANPTSIEAESFHGFQSAGVNRVSIGVQALNNPDLRRLGRMHSADEALDAISIARRTFDRVSFDLIYARQDQSLADWEAELSQAFSFDPSHLSLYQLTIEDGTVFGERHKRGLLSGLPDEDLAADLYDATQVICETAGLPAYEVSNHAKPGQNSRHNLIYWRAGDYLGVGPGAHGRITLDGQRYSTETPLSPAGWLSAVNKGFGEGKRQRLSPRDDGIERLVMGLRIAEGISRSDLPDGLLCDTGLRDMVDAGLVETKQDQISVTPKGRPVLNGILRQIVNS